MSLGEKKFGALVDALYDGDEQHRWRRVASALGSILGGGTTRIMATSASGEVLLDALTLGWPSKLLSEYDEHYYARDPRVRTAFSRVGTIVSCTDLPDPERYAKSEIVDFLDRPDIDARWGILQVVRARTGTQMLVGASRGRKAGPFLAADKRSFGIALRHVHHALELETRLISLQREKTALELSLDAAAIPMIVLTRDLRVLRVNGQAEALLARDAGLQYRNGRLKATSADDQRALETIVGAADALRSGAPHLTETAVIHAREGSRTLIRAYALPRSSFVAGEDAGQCILLLSTGGRSIDRSVGALLDSFRLTHAEQRVVRHVLRGSTLSAAADAFGISRETVRSQLKSARGKLGVRSQADLVRLLTGYQH